MFTFIAVVESSVLCPSVDSKIETSINGVYLIYCDCINIFLIAELVITKITFPFLRKLCWTIFNYLFETVFDTFTSFYEIYIHSYLLLLSHI